MAEEKEEYTIHTHFGYADAEGNPNEVIIIDTEGNFRIKGKVVTGAQSIGNAFIEWKDKYLESLKLR